MRVTVIGTGYEPHLDEVLRLAALRGGIDFRTELNGAERAILRGVRT